MKRIHVLLLLGCLAVPGLRGDCGSVEQCIAIGDSLADLGEHDAALKAFLNVLDQDSMNYDANWKAGDQFTEVAKNLPSNEKEAKEDQFDLARQCCEKAIEINPDGWEGHTYLAIALGRLALFRGGKEKINMSKQIKAEADKGIELNPFRETAVRRRASGFQ